MKPKKTTNATYDESNVKVLKGLNAVRTRPGMYMGERGDEMIRRMLKEIVDNSIDEALAGRNTHVETVINIANNEYIVADSGGGIPVGKHKEEKVSVLELLFSSLHAGGKFDDAAYKTSSGTHGVGAACTNALSDVFTIYTQRDSVWYTQSYEKGVKKTEVSRIKLPPKEITARLQKTTKEYGTIIRFIPDQTVVSIDATDARVKPKNYAKAKLDVRAFVEWTRMIALFNPGLKMVTSFEDKKKTATFHNTKGLEAVVNHIIEKNELSRVAKPFVLQTDNLDIALQWTSYDELDLFNTYVNCGRTRDHGKHFDGFRDALQRALTLHKGKTDKFKTIDAMYGMVGALNYKMSGAEFSSQTKDRLTSNVGKAVEETVYEALVAFFDKNKTLAKTIIKRAMAITKGRDELKKVMKSVTDVKKSGKGALLPNNLVVSSTKDPMKRELFIVEGDSAGGTAKVARFSDYQEILKLTGKPANSLRAPLAKVLAMKALQHLMVALGIDGKTLDTEQEDMSKMTFSTKNLRVGSVYMLADADVDGGHINCLVLSLIWRVVPDLIREGRVFIVDAPLYNVFHNNKRYFGATFDDVVAQLPKGAPTNMISRAKGWGEISPEALRYVAFDPKTRRVLRVLTPPNGEAEEYFRAIMGENSQVRKDLLGL